MRYIKLIIIAAIFVLSPLFSNAQRSDKNFPESVILNTQFSRDLVWDVQRFPIYPIDGREWKLSGLKSPYDADSKSQIDWGRFNSRYLMFDIEVDYSNRPGSLYDERTGKKYSVSLNLYDSDGRFVKRVSRWGNLMGFGRAGFMYEQEGRFGTFFSVSHQREGDIIIYRPELIKAIYLSNIMNFGRDNGRGQYGKDGYRGDDHRNDGYKGDDHRNDGYRNDDQKKGDYRNDNQGRYGNDQDKRDGGYNAGEYRDGGNDFRNIKLTFKRFSEEGSRYLKDAIRREYRGDCEVADWNDLKAIMNIDGWIASMKLRRGQTFMVTKSGRFTYGDKRQYFVLYSPYGELPTGFLTHDKISNKLYLGSWYGEARQVLIKDRVTTKF